MASTRSRLVLQLALGLLLSAVLIWLSVRKINLAEVGHALAAANWAWFVPACGLTLLAFWIRAVRWGWMLKSVKPIHASSLFSATMIGFAANNLLPARPGEFVRPWLLGTNEHISRSAVFATIVVERVIDMFCILVLLGIVLLLHPAPPMIQKAGLGALGANLVLLVALLLIERKPEHAETLARFFERRLPTAIGSKVGSLMRNFAGGLGVFRSGPGLFWVIVYSLLLFGVTSLGLTACMAAFHLSVPWYAGLVMLVVTAFGIMVAPTPGYLGAIQYACKLGLSLFGVGAATAFSFSLYYHVSQFLPITVVGLFYLGRQGLSLTQVAAASREEVRPTT
jgi:uncharacterized protein (TIRG00374 family)